MAVNVSAVDPIGHPKSRATGARLTPSAKHAAIVWAGRLIMLAVFCAVWEYVARNRIMNPVFIGMPTEILRSFASALTGSVLRVDAVATIVSTLAGFAIAAVIGVAMAMFLTQAPAIDEMVQPFFTALNSMPRVALAPLFIMWFGIGPESKVALSASLVFFVVLLNTMAGIQGVDPDHVAVARSLGARPLEVFLKIKLPSAIPSIFAGMELGMIYGFLGTVAGEMLAGAEGLGVRLQEYSGLFRTNDFFAVLLLLVCITTTISVVLRRIRRSLLRWQDRGPGRAAG